MQKSLLVSAGWVSFVIVVIFTGHTLSSSHRLPCCMGSILYAGPWYGEFGWELCAWNPAVRNVAKFYDRVVVASHTASEYLYEFADEFVPLEAEGWSMWDGRLHSPLPNVVATRALRPQEVLAGYGAKLDSTFVREWHRLAPPNPTKVADVLCAFRPPKKHISKQRANKAKSYPQEMCARVVDILLSQGLSVACFGGLDNWWFDGTGDLRGKPLTEQCSALAAAGCALGPSSGTMHLASLCGCPHVTWYTPATHKTLFRRYEEKWNPFGTAVQFLPDHPPTPEQVAHAARIFAR